jgi:hypothetical protein
MQQWNQRCQTRKIILILKPNLRLFGLETSRKLFMNAELDSENGRVELCESQA